MVKGLLVKVKGLRFMLEGSGLHAKGKEYMV